MTDQDGFEEAVLVFEPDLSAVASQMHFAEFESLIEGAAQLEQFAASVVKAAYVVVGTALSIRGIVFFTFKVDEEGQVDPSFNLPLRYLIQNAGAGPDIGTGPIRLACRGQCPVPWHSVNLWEPQGEGDDHPANVLQKVVWRNRLGLRPTATSVPMRENDLVLEESREEQRKLEVRLTQTFGEEGRVNLENLIRQHNDQLTKVSSRHRSELEGQQQTYLDQIRSCRDEIQKLKSALRNEQERTRRLQQLLRGDP